MKFLAMADTIAFLGSARRRSPRLGMIRMTARVAIYAHYAVVATVVGRGTRISWLTHDDVKAQSRISIAVVGVFQRSPGRRLSSPMSRHADQLISATPV